MAVCDCEGNGILYDNIFDPPPCELGCTDRCNCGKLICQHYLHMKLPSQTELDMFDESYCPEHWAKMEAAICHEIQFVECDEEDTRECHYDGICQKIEYSKGKWHLCEHYYCSLHVPDPRQCRGCGAPVTLCPTHLFSQEYCWVCFRK